MAVNIEEVIKNGSYVPLGGPQDIKATPYWDGQELLLVLDFPNGTRAAYIELQDCYTIDTPNGKMLVKDELRTEAEARTMFED